MSAVNRNLIMHTLILHSKMKDYAQAQAVRCCERMQHAAHASAMCSRPTCHLSPKH